MWCSFGVKGLRCLLVILAVLSVSAQDLLFSNIVVAQSRIGKREVVRHEYLIKPRMLGAAGEGLVNGKLSEKRLRVKKALGAVTLLGPVTAEAVMIQGGAEEFVAEDPDDPTCKELVKSGIAVYCEPNYKLSINATANDPRLSQLWGLSAGSGINAPYAWDRTTGSSDVVVAVIDTGVDYRHQDLAPNIWTNSNEIPANGIDDDRNGYVDDVHGMNAYSHNGDPMDDNGHGTHVSGTIGAVGNNGTGVAGINWGVRIMALKFLNARGSGSVAGAIEAINYMVAMKQRGVNVRISNNSWGGGGYSQALYEAIARANAAGIIFVAAAGNDSNDNDISPAYPASYELPNVVSVAALDENRNLAWFSNYGALAVDIAAPGVAIESTIPGNTYASYSGTSMATPHVSGSLALLLAAEPGLSNDALTERLYASGVPLSSLNGLVRTGRMLNVGRMVNNETQPLPQPTPEVPSCDYAVSAISAPPDTSADAGQVIFAGADEYNYKTVNLPFSFSFDGNEFDTVTVSPNGVLYMGTRALTTMDYQNSRQAPLNSIAALQTDLVSTVRVVAGTDSATFFWSGYYYSHAQAGTAEVRLRISAQGTIQEWVSFTDEGVERLVQNAGTVGITGRSSLASHTYAYNSQLIRNGLSLEYRPLCGVPRDNQPVRINNLKMWGIESHAGRKKLVRTLTPGAGFKVRMVMSNTGLARRASIGFVLGAQHCQDAREIELRPGNLSFRGRMPRAAVSFKKFSVIVDNLSVSRPLRDTHRNRSVRRRALSPNGFDRLCRHLGNSLRGIR